MKNSKGLNDDFVFALINSIFLDESMADVCFEHLKSIYISDKVLQHIWKVYTKLRKKGRTYPSLNFTQQFIESDSNKNNEVVVLNEQAIEYLSEMRGKVKADLHIEELIDGFEDFLKESMFVESYNQMGESWNRGEKNEAFGHFQNTANNINAFSLRADIGVKLFADFDRRYAERSVQNYLDNAVQIPFGLHGLNHATHGGAWTKETELWLGDSGMGKTTLLVSRGVDAALLGYNVLHVSGEGTKRQLQDKYDANFTKSPHYQLKTDNISMGKFKAYSAKVKKYLKQESGEVYMHGFESFESGNMLDVRRLALEYLRKGITLHMIIIDYLELFDPADGKQYDYEGAQQARQKKVARMMKNLSVETNTLVVTATQSNTISPEKTNDPNFVLTRWNIGEAKRVLEPFSYVYTINRTNDERKLKRARVYTEKMRDHQSGQVFPVAQALEMGRFFDYKATMELIEEMDELEDDR